MRTILPYLMVVRKSTKIDRLPFHIVYVMKRTGEFVMLLIGEGVVQIILVQHKDKQLISDYFATVVCGFLLLASLHVFIFAVDQFEDANKHAGRYSRLLGFSCQVLKVVFMDPGIEGGVHGPRHHLLGYCHEKDLE